MTPAVSASLVPRDDPRTGNEEACLGPIILSKLRKEKLHSDKTSTVAWNEQ